MLAGILAAASIFALLYLAYVSFSQKGNGSVYLGSAGVLALFAAAVSFAQAVRSLREEDTFRGIPVFSVVLSILAAAAWIAIYAAGFAM